ncbi:hypothetical protein [Salsipaludibacter albus]|uniref:hypothetical protein n=1 Tax=Salsipaludibacter albus TaxID=2849650 RepID=UPI001EE3E4F5|nr:hypothetical protein [Salsipaludibacter albus]MBY5162729.1 hypothetical protein [Salsipaludibacter albus]
MSARPTTTSQVRTDQRPTTGRRAGYVIAIGVNGLLLWLLFQLGDWGWPAFVTDDLALVVGAVSASLVASVLANGVYLVADGGRIRAAGELVTTSVGLVAAVRVWDVFPFDFSAYAVDWTWLVRTLLVIAIVGSMVAIVVHLVRLVRPDPD